MCPALTRRDILLFNLALYDSLGPVLGVALPALVVVWIADGRQGARERASRSLPCRAARPAALRADLELVAEAGDGAQAIPLATQLQPDVIVMDLQMPGIGGIDATRRIMHTSPHIGVLVLSMFEDDDSVFPALQAGARGYLLRGSSKPKSSARNGGRRQRRGHLRPRSSPSD